MPNTITTTVNRIERLNNSVNGNPRYRFHCDNGASYTLSSDAGYGYGVSNDEREMLSGTPFTFHLTRAGRVTHAHKAA